MPENRDQADEGSQESTEEQAWEEPVYNPGLKDKSGRLEFTGSESNF